MLKNYFVCLIRSFAQSPWFSGGPHTINTYHLTIFDNIYHHFIIYYYVRYYLSGSPHKTRGAEQATPGGWKHFVEEYKLYHVILAWNASIQILALADNARLQSTAHSGDARLWLGHIGPTIQDFGGWAASGGEIVLNLRPHEHPCHLPPYCPLLILLLQQTKLSPFLFFRNQRWAQFCVRLLLFSLNNFLFLRNKLCISRQQAFKASKLLF